MISFSLGYPDAKAERNILLNNTKKANITNKLSTQEIAELKQGCSEVHVSDDLLDYLQSIIHFSRDSGIFHKGLSTRAAISLSNVCKSFAFIQGRDYVTPQDVQHMLPHVIAHRLEMRSNTTDETASEIIINSLNIDQH